MSSNNENRQPSQSTVRAPTPGAIANAGEIETSNYEEKDDDGVGKTYSQQQSLSPSALAVRPLNAASVSPNLHNQILGHATNHHRLYMGQPLPQPAFVPAPNPATPFPTSTHDLKFSWELSGEGAPTPYMDLGSPPSQFEGPEPVQPADPEPVYEPYSAPTPDPPRLSRSRRASLTRDARNHPYASPGGIRSSISANTGLNTPSRARQHPSHNRVASLSRFQTGHIPSPLLPAGSVADMIFRGADGNPYPVPVTNATTPGWMPTPHIGTPALRAGEGMNIQGRRLYPARPPAYPEPWSPVTQLAAETMQLGLGLEARPAGPPAIPVPSPGDLETTIRGSAIEALRDMATKPRGVNFADPTHVTIFSHYLDIVMLPHLDEVVLRRFHSIISSFARALYQNARYLNENQKIIPREIVKALDDLRERAIKLFGHRATLVDMCTGALGNVQLLVDQERRAMELLEADEDL